jgi:putative MATE family efflux protein
MTITKEFLKIFIPIVITMIVISIHSVIDAYFISTISEKALAGVNLFFPILLAIVSMLGGYASSISIVVASAYGGGFHNRVAQKITIGVLISVIFSLILTIIGYLSLKYIINSYGVSEEVSKYAFEYGYIWLSIIIFESLIMIGTFGLNGVSLAKNGTFLNVLATFLNIGLNYILIFGINGFLNPLGVTGAALGTVIAKIIHFLVLYWYLNKKGLIQIKIPKLKLIILMKKILKIAIPLTFQGLLFPMALFMLSILLAKEGTTAISAFAVYTKLEILFVVVASATSTGLMILMSKYIGSKNKLKVKKSFDISLRIIVYYTLFLTFLFIIFSNNISNLYLETQESINRSIYTMILLSFGFIPWGIHTIIRSGFAAQKMGYWSTSLSMFRSIISVFLIPIIGQKYGGFQGIMIGMLIGNYLAAIYAIIIWKLKNKAF